MKEKQKLNDQFSYDTLSYPGHILPITHPDCLAVIAKLYGMNPASADKCRVLELGCGDGINLIWLAHNLPKSEFVGVDLGESHIIEAKENVEDLQLQNIKFFQEDVLKISKDSFGTFDYIIAHGLFSWVPNFVREKILSLYDELLNPNGVGFISYNVYPGCYRRQIVSDMMRYHTQRFKNPQEKVEQGVAFIGFLTENVTSPTYQEILKYEYEGFGTRPAQNIYHDDLADVNQPFYFTEFIAEAEKHNLKFLSESDYLVDQRAYLSGDAAETIKNIAQNIIEYEQYSDFIECRRFRQTLLCKKEVELKEKINPSDLANFYISSVLTPTSPTIDLNPDSHKEFISSRGETVRISHVLTKIVLAELVNLGSHPIKFSYLINKSYEVLKKQGIIYENLDEEVLITASILLQLYSPNGIAFHIFRPNLLDYVNEKPILNKFSLWQSNKDSSMANFYGVGLNVDSVFTRKLLSLLDGTNNREDLITALTETVHLSEEITDKEAFLNDIEESLNRDLFILAKMGFLIE